MQIIRFSDQQLPQSFQNEITEFLFEHLQEFGDPAEDIQLALDYAGQKNGGKGGHVLVAKENNEILGAVVVNKTGMKRYIPENILVYIATHSGYRGKGIGGKLMQEAIHACEGDIALHCEPDNPARQLYEKLGFTSKYLEMRLTKNNNVDSNTEHEKAQGEFHIS
ncbi:GNAT family N-acetyltransferase [Chryseobacterium sp. MFBS3-17]|uniref:GNAT family N-acetyltransferase n=1 Tax=Chryseobacterium sp. MFBS3-17 TaxID=2886689 RepID=UPI001D0E0DE1|nr:GNAT family N-acetyltransferase [Chryseobacterium sp. MFBS3-17]MCC2589804.1 GNAT family N-acetyltransferase [Chryseobacterium sp. MFBS3-17]